MSENLKSKKEFILSAVWKALITFGIILLVFIIIKRTPSESYIAYLEPFTSRPIVMYSIFLLSEAIIGIFPPEFFMMWALSDNIYNYYGIVMILATLSYIGGFSAFWFGNLFRQTAFLQRHIHTKKNQKYLDYYEQYGGVIILIAAVTPLPFALISTLSGAVGYKFANYMKFAVFRILRFVIYAYIIWHVDMI